MSDGKGLGRGELILVLGAAASARRGAGDDIQRGAVSVVYGFWGIEWWSRCQPSFVLAFIMGL